MVNYRGSTGYGRDGVTGLIGDIGGPELVDVNAGLADLVARGIADPARAVVGGWSWGGYITLMELCKHPDLWLAGVAGMPVGDYELGVRGPLAGAAGVRPGAARWDARQVPGLMPTATPSTSSTRCGHR